MLRQLIAWCVAVAAAAVLLVALNVHTHDPDSELHRAIVQDLASQPPARWIAPSWGGHWGWGGFELYTEHPAGVLIMPLLLVKLGYPASQASYLLNALFQVLTILLVQQLALIFVSHREARSVAWLIQLLPIAFAYRIRANHEQILLAMFLMALLATERSRARGGWTGLTAIAVTMALLVKGIFAFLLPVACAAWLIVRPPETRANRIRAWAGLAGSVALALGVAVCYELAFRSVTGESFVTPYLQRQLGLAAVQRAAGAVVLQKILNAGWYLGRIAWFAFPWSVILMWAGWRMVAAWRRKMPVPRATAMDARSLWLWLGIAAGYVCLFSLSDRRADRYIFPVYFLVAGVGVIVARRTVPALNRLASRLDRFYPYELAATWLLTFLMAVPGDFWKLFPSIKLFRN